MLNDSNRKRICYVAIFTGKENTFSLPFRCYCSEGSGILNWLLTGTKSNFTIFVSDLFIFTFTFVKIKCICAHVCVYVCTHTTCINKPQANEAHICAKLY